MQLDAELAPEKASTVARQSEVVKEHAATLRGYTIKTRLEWYLSSAGFSHLPEIEEPLCNFRELHDDMIRDRIVVGMRDHKAVGLGFSCV
ncbi:hypothetical protein MTO96_039292 [Rhipicephalus appendiculatus]